MAPLPISTIPVPASSRVHSAGVDLLRHEALRVGGLAAVLLLRPREAPGLHAIAAFTVDPVTGRLPWAWHEPIADGGLVQSAMDGEPQLLSPQDLGGDRWPLDADAALSLPVVDHGAPVGLVVVFVDHVGLREVLSRDQLWARTVSAPQLAMAHAYDEHERRAVGGVHPSA